MQKVKHPWIAFFSQTGSEIVSISLSLNRWPDMVITNKRPDHLRKINEILDEECKIHYVENKPSDEELMKLIDKYENPIITLHGWLRVMSPEMCDKYHMFNGHPGLITWYPELKGKDPQVRTFEGIKEGIYPVAGAVIHKVTAGVDEGKIISEEKFNTFGLDLKELFRILRNRSEYMWIKLLRDII